LSRRQDGGSSTSTLHTLVRAFGIREGHEVITTSFSFIASSNCILYELAKPVFVDIEPDTPNIGPDLIEDAVAFRTDTMLPTLEESDSVYRRP